MKYWTQLNNTIHNARRTDMKDKATHLMYPATGPRGIARHLTGALALTLALTAMPALAATSPPALNADAIGTVAHSKASVTDDGVVKIGWARTDVVVNVDGAPLPPPAGLGSWAAFTPVAQGALVMGDTVVFQDGVVSRNPRKFCHPNSSPATSASRSIILPPLWKV